MVKPAGFTFGTSDMVSGAAMVMSGGLVSGFGVYVGGGT
jgi:hypothetical protein